LRERGKERDGEREGQRERERERQVKNFPFSGDRVGVPIFAFGLKEAVVGEFPDSAHEALNNP
jgi:hypothetical protein